MSAIVIGRAPRNPQEALANNPADHMPFSTRLKVAGEINQAWKEFVEDMHDGDLTGPEVADKFWRFVTGK